MILGDGDIPPFPKEAWLAEIGGVRVPTPYPCAKGLGGSIGPLGMYVDEAVLVDRLWFFPAVPDNAGEFMACKEYLLVLPCPDIDGLMLRDGFDRNSCFEGLFML